MPQFTNWEWQGEGDYYSLVGIDPMGEGLNQYSVLAEIRQRKYGSYCGWVLLPHFDTIEQAYTTYFDNLDELQSAIERNLILSDIIKEKDKGVIE